MIKNNYANQVSQSSKKLVGKKYVGNNYTNHTENTTKPVNNCSNNRSARLAAIDQMLAHHTRLQELFQKKYTPRRLQYSPSSKYFTKIHETRAVKVEHLEKSIETKAESIRVAKLW
jgi:hypothetical protein